MNVPGRLLERLTIYTPLGIRFWDPSLDAAVSDGLEVWAYSRTAADPPVRATRTPSGTYAFQGLPGMRSVEYPSATTAVIGSPPSPTGFLIAVEDARRRFLPCVFGVELPLSYRGLFLVDDPALPPGSVPGAVLFSAPTRIAPGGIAAIRADLWDQAKGAPAGHAILAIVLDGRRWTGIADGNGRAVVLCPYPLLERLRLGSPPGAAQGAVTAQRWPVRAEVFYQPAALTFPLRDKVGEGAPWGEIPSLKSIRQQEATAPADVWARAQDAPASRLDSQLTYADELVLQTDGLDEESSGRLLVAAAASPP